VCVCVCLSASISLEPHARYLPNFVHVAYGRGSVILRRGDEIHGKGAILFFFPIDNALYERYSGMNFAMKNRFGLNLIRPIYRKVRHNSISGY